MAPSKIVSGGRSCSNPPPPPILQFFFINISADASVFAHLQNSTVDNTVTDATGLVHVHRLVDLIKLTLYVIG